MLPLHYKTLISQAANPSGHMVSKAWVCWCLLAGMANWNPAGAMDACLFWALCVVMGLSLVRRSPTMCGVSECDQGTSQRRPRLTEAGKPWEKKEKENLPHKCQTQTLINLHEIIIKPVFLDVTEWWIPEGTKMTKTEMVKMFLQKGYREQDKESGT